MTTVKHASGGLDFTLALLASGSVVAAGNNAGGQLGIGTIVDSTLFVASVPTGLAGSAVQGARYSSGAVSTDGRVWAWGSNTAGQLGADTPAWRSVALPLGSPSAGLRVSAGKTHSLALTASGGVWSWGSNGAAQLGDGTLTSRSTPMLVPGFTVGDNSWLLADPDNDGLPTWREYLLGLDPLNWDSSGAGIGDRALASQMEQAGNTDPDADGVPSAVEVLRGTDPYRADTDGDGVNDNLDAYPLDPTRWQAPAVDPNDHTPPVITLTEPTNAILLP